MLQPDQPHPRSAPDPPDPSRSAEAGTGRLGGWWRGLRPESRDLGLVGLGFTGAFLAALATDAFDQLYDFAHRHEDWELDEILAALLIMPFGFAAYAIRRLQDVRREMALRRQAEAEARQLAVHDALTGLPNRRSLADGLQRSLARARREGGAVAALMVDLDRFKPVNDLRGHAAGDRLLRMVAERLLGTTREVDLVARLGGDEFAIAGYFGSEQAPDALAAEGAAGAGGPEDAAEAASRLARRVVAALEEPFDLRDGAASVLVGASVGVALASEVEGGAEELLRRADLAMYRAKADGRACFRFFEPEMDTRIRHRAEMEAELRRAIAGDELVPHFQPLVALGAGRRIVGLEMLVRWPHPVRGMIPPAEFIPIAADTGLIVPMTERLLRQACRAALSWPDEISLAVNVSPIQLRDRALPSLVAAVLADSGLPARRLEIELTETGLVENFEMARDLLTELKALGVRLTLDDFGTGYSSLRHLQTLPFDQIKIDAGFVRSMAASPESGKIVAAVVGLGHSLGLPTVAEGVEDAATAAVLARMGCDIGQGWFFGAAVAEAEAGRLVRDRAALAS
ncbi:putative bifunctional diguanylate cyclase/phosphodiesterase [Muricoccus roseus]|nr:EAL domain-containing protein [Roseomonas rosea]